MPPKYDPKNSLIFNFYIVSEKFNNISHFYDTSEKNDVNVLHIWYSNMTLIGRPESK